MKTTNVHQGRLHHEAIIRGWVSPRRAGGTGVSVTDGSTSADGITSISVVGGTLIDNGDGTVIIVVDATGIGTVDDGTTTVEDVTAMTVPPGGMTDLGGGAIQLNFLVNTYEGHATQFIASSGSALDLDLSAYGTFYIVLDDDCTLTFSGTVPSGVDARWTVVLIQGGSGSYTVTWPAAVVWQDTDGTPGGSAATLFTAVGAQDVVELSSLDGATTVGASHGGGSAASLTVQDEGTPLATSATTLNFVGAGVTASGTGATKTITIPSLTAANISALGFVGPILISDSPSTPLVFADLLQNDGQDDLMYADL
jgi:hypothetical protein